MIDNINTNIEPEICQDPQNDNILFFNNDDEFTEFSIDPTLVAKCIERKNGDKIWYYDFNFSKLYNDAVAQGKKFTIKDPNSRIMKNGDIGYKLVTKPVENLEEYIE